MSASANFNRRLGWGLLLVCIVAASGCGGNARQNMSGKVTYDGEPVQQGTIVFTQAGTVGGHASIRDGVYDTAEGTNLGVLPGMNDVVIKGYHPAEGDDVPRKPLFPPYEKQIEVMPGSKGIDFNVPAK